MAKIKNRIGEVKIMNNGEKATIVEYSNANNIVVRFDKTNNIVKSTYSSFSKGQIRDGLLPVVYNIGVIGNEPIKVKGKVVDSYKLWRHMLERCYDEKYHEKFPTYKNCFVCEEWLFFPNFKKWYEEKYYKLEGRKTHLDKDILHKGNKVYSPDSCSFVPDEVNVLLTKHDSARGKYPIGVTKRGSRYVARVNIYGRNKTIGYYNTPEEAFLSYKKEKEKQIKEVAEKYKGVISDEVYNALLNYEVEITD